MGGHLALVCEQFRDGLLGQPASAVTSLAFVAAGLALLAGWRAHRPPRQPCPPRWPYALLVAAVGVGSLIQHGPHPPWQAFAHDLPLAAVLAFVAADCVADVTNRPRRTGWWLVPVLVMVPVVALGATASTVAQTAVAVVAIGSGLLRAWRRPAVRRTVLVALALLAVGSLVGTVGDRTALCTPESIWQAHAAWHVLAAAALWWLGPVIGTRAPGADLPST